MKSFNRLIILILFFPLFLSSHQRSESYSNWNIEIKDEVLKIKSTLSARESVLLNLNLDDLPTLESYLMNSINLSDCELNDFVSKLTYREGLYKFSINQECFLGESSQFLITNNAFFDIDASHSHIAKIKINGLSLIHI